jgi:hypothetical protein
LRAVAIANPEKKDNFKGVVFKAFDATKTPFTLSDL